jgi:uncharacterized damage-inducible protein DinB
MNRFIILVTSIALAGWLHAQPKGGPLDTTGDLKQSYNEVKGWSTAAAAKMPEADYGYQASPEEMTFGQWVAHVADTQAFACGVVTGAAQQLNARLKSTKADLQAVLKQSFDICDAVYDGTTMANRDDTVQTFRGPRPRASWLYWNIAHDNECYGSMAVYLRLKGQVPPSSEGRGGGKGGGKKQ